jgi:hypothetical protein
MHRSDQTAGAGHSDVPGPALLGIYLNDHLAGATLGTELASRIAGAHRETDESEAYERFATEVAEDRATLLEIMAALEVPVRQYKVALGWVAEKAARLKLNGHLFTRSPLSSLEEVEIMRLGVEGKLAAWRTLQVMAGRDDRLDPARLDDLVRRAGEQIAMLEELRVRIMAELVEAV